MGGGAGLEECGRGGSAEALTKDTPDQRACLGWPTKCHLSHHFFLTPDGKITRSVIFLHSKISGCQSVGGDPAYSI